MQCVGNGRTLFDLIKLTFQAKGSEQQESRYCSVDASLEPLSIQCIYVCRYIYFVYLRESTVFLNQCISSWEKVQHAPLHFLED